MNIKRFDRVKVLGQIGIVVGIDKNGLGEDYIKIQLGNGSTYCTSELNKLEKVN